MNFEKYDWLSDLSSTLAQNEMLSLRRKYESTGAITLPHFITHEALPSCLDDVLKNEDTAFTTDDYHTAYLQDPDLQRFTKTSVFNHRMRTRVASLAYDELPTNSMLKSLYENPILLRLVSFIVQKELYLSVDPLGCCSINIFRPGYYHAFHFDESHFSTTLMIQEADDLDSGLFQHTDILRKTPSNTENDNLALTEVASTITTYKDDSTAGNPIFSETEYNSELLAAPTLHTLDFHPGTLSIFSGARSLHRVTTVRGSRSRLVAVFTFSTIPNFRNSAAVQRLFWGRSSDDNDSTIQSKTQ